MSNPIINPQFALSIKQLTKRYRSGVQALNQIDLAIESGDYFALLGPNGAGKTTLINVLTSLVRKTSGSVIIYDYDIDKNFSSAKTCIGIVPQETNFNIFETVENIAIDQAGFYGVPYKIAKKRAEYYLKQLDLWGKRHSSARQLSGGMKRRLMIVRALIHEPKMLILDEPTAGVDVELRRSMWNFLRTLNNSGITIILTTHYLEEAESQCRNIAIIDHGKIIEHTKMSHLLRKLNFETLVLSLDRPYENLPIIEDIPISAKDSMTLEIKLPRNIAISQLFQHLHAHNIQVANVRNKSSRLEELYMNLTQRNTQDE